MTVKTDYNETITLEAESATNITLQITPPEGYSYLCTSQIETNGNVTLAYALYKPINSNPFSMTVWLCNDSSKQKILSNGLSATIIYVKSGLVNS